MEYSLYPEWDQNGYELAVLRQNQRPFVAVNQADDHADEQCMARESAEGGDQ